MMLGVRESWTDPRLDELNHRVQELLPRVEALTHRAIDVANRVDSLNRRVDEVGLSVRDLDRKVGEGFREADARIDALQRTLIALGGTIVAALVGVLATLLATHL
jgi:two-component sensor histidine kinase